MDGDRRANRFAISQKCTSLPINMWTTRRGVTVASALAGVGTRRSATWWGRWAAGTAQRDCRGSFLGLATVLNCPGTGRRVGGRRPAALQGDLTGRPLPRRHLLLTLVLPSTPSSPSPPSPRAKAMSASPPSSRQASLIAMVSKSRAPTLPGEVAQVQASQVERAGTRPAACWCSLRARRDRPEPAGFPPGALDNRFSAAHALLSTPYRRPSSSYASYTRLSPSAFTYPAFRTRSCLASSSSRQT